MREELEQMARNKLAELQVEYHAKAQPWIDILVGLEALRPPKPVFIPMHELSESLCERLGLSVTNPGETP